MMSILFCGINVRYVPRETLYLTFSLLYYILALDGRKIEIVNPQMNERDDLMQDFVSIVTSFCARLYGKRRTKRQTEKIIEELTNDNK